MKCSICGEELSFEDDAIEQLIEAGVISASNSLVGDHHHLHPTEKCPGDPEVLAILEP